jgi:GT2 family glycosyltransferase
LLNNDVTVINPEWLLEMVSHVMRRDVGAVGAKLYYPNDTIQHAGVIVGICGVAGHSHKYLPRDNAGYFRRLSVTQNLSAVTGACLVVRKENYSRVGGLEEGLTVAFNDVDFCLKLDEIGLRNVWTPYAELYHHESASRGPEDSPGKVARFQEEIRYMQTRWGERLRRDPYYSPLLTLDWETFTPDYRAQPRKPWLEGKSGKAGLTQ